MTPDDPRRPDPDALLSEVGRSGRARLKVFVGMAPGVGKTFEMLGQARRRIAEGGEVLAGVIETHGRAETEALLDGIEVLPRKAIDYRGGTIGEFDLDAALTRRPALLLVDEFAHTNAPGSRHPKRWQDVEELLDAGIDVWTTLNVQHLASLNDVVLKITGVRQRETVPDAVLSRADEIEVVDITPGELRRRMGEGKVYLPDTAALAADRFFKTENLVALRELALRWAAQTVDEELLGAMRRAGVEGPWAAGERIAVLIGPDAAATSLVRAARRLSDMTMDSPWTVIHVERPNAPPPSAAAAARLAEALKLTQELGGSAVVLSGDDIVAGVSNYVRRNNITQIVVGAPSRRRFGALFGRSLPHALLEQLSGAALHVITGPAAPPPAAPRPASTSLRNWLGYGASLAFVAVANLVAFLVGQLAEQANLAMIFLVCVLLSAMLFGFWPAVLAAAAAAVTYNFFFLEPRLSFYIGHASDVLTFAVFFIVALATGWMAGRLRDQSRANARRASAVSALLAASQRLSGAAEKGEAAKALAEQLAAATGAGAVIFLPEGGDIRPFAAAPDMPSFSPADEAAARWAWEKGEAAGPGTGTLPNAAWHFRPLQGVRARSGVAAVAPAAPGAGDDRYVVALLGQGAVALERAEFAAEAADAEALRRADRLRSALLNSISHDLRTPLSAVLGSSTTLIDYGATLDAATRADLLDSIKEEAERLNRYVGDLLDMTRLEGGALATRRDWLDLPDVLAAATERVSRRLGRRRFERDFPPDLPPIQADPGLLEQAVVNILENAIGYSPDGTAIELAVYEDARNLVISIEDEGPGIPTPELERVFEKFRRMADLSDRVKGSGLGLAIAKGFVEAMGGRIAAASPIHDGRGTRILISLPKAPKGAAPAGGDLA